MHEENHIKIYKSRDILDNIIKAIEKRLIYLQSINNEDDHTASIAEILLIILEKGEKNLKNYLDLRSIIIIIFFANYSKNQLNIWDNLFETDFSNMLKIDRLINDVSYSAMIKNNALKLEQIEKEDLFLTILKNFDKKQPIDGCLLELENEDYHKSLETLRDDLFLTIQHLLPKDEDKNEPKQLNNYLQDKLQQLLHDLSS